MKQQENQDQNFTKTISVGGKREQIKATKRKLSELYHPERVIELSEHTNCDYCPVQTPEDQLMDIRL